MVTLSLTEKEIEVLKKSINHCIETCQDRDSDNGCPDCESLRDVLKKL